MSLPIVKLITKSIALTPPLKQIHNARLLKISFNHRTRNIATKKTNSTNNSNKGDIKHALNNNILQATLSLCRMLCIRMQYLIIDLANPKRNCDMWTPQCQIQFSNLKQYNRSTSHSTLPKQLLKKTARARVNNKIATNFLSSKGHMKQPKHLFSLRAAKILALCILQKQNP